VPVAWYHGGAAALDLGEEWTSTGRRWCPGRGWRACRTGDHPRWDPVRIERTVMDLFQRGELTVEGMLNPKVPIEEAAEAYRLIDEHRRRA